MSPFPGSPGNNTGHESKKSGSVGIYGDQDPDSLRDSVMSIPENLAVPHSGIRHDAFVLIYARTYSHSGIFVVPDIVNQTPV